ncbi:polysaccharide pyruvyl transferase family protein [uncultured Gelidibacter sp.]|uniref:polysaccharide pyruvyl transferase family protein n=1 Tax=uncultured Gelidibacter sp. TaxID=259318 RepID=UPI0026273549|nr:polysaccharide pyruvyl transferase family protein [uncultured Gelidibacter sp.]
MKSKILIKGNFSEGNFGDDALLLACHQFLTKLGLDDDTVYDCDELYYPRDLAANANVGSPSSNDVQLVLYAGGTQFFSFTSKKSGFIEKLKIRLSAYKWMINQRSKYAMIGVGLGPFNNGIKEDIFASSILKKSSFTWVRDQYSYEECRSLNLQNYHLGADLCFLSEFQEWCNFKINPANNIKKIGVVLRHWKYEEGNAYVNKLIELSELLKKDNFELEFYLFSDKEDVAVENLLLEHKVGFIKWDAKIFSFKGFLSQLESCDLFITARFHTAIFSTLMYKPFITVGLDQKLTYLASQFDNDCFNWDPKDSVDVLYNKVTSINKNYNSLKENIVKTKSQMEILSNDAGILFRDYLKSNLT